MQCSSNFNATNPFCLLDPEECAIADDLKSTKTVITNSDDKEDDTTSADLHIIVHVSNLVSLQIDHFQYLFLLRLSEEMTELTTFLSLDSNRILQKVSHPLD